MEDTIDSIDNKNFDAPEWVAFSLTLVEYPKNDLLGKALAAFSLLPFVFVVLHFGFFVVIRDCHSFFLGIGVILNHGINFLLKISIQELRPFPTFRKEGTHYSKYGMPSTHAQHMTFAVFYMFMFTLFRLPHGGSRMETTIKGLFLFLNTLAAAVVLYGRIYLMYHTVEQVFYGSLIGMLLAYVWFWLTQNVLTPLFPWLSSTWWAELFGINDLTNIPNVARFLAFSLRDEARRRKRE